MTEKYFNSLIKKIYKQTITPHEWDMLSAHPEMEYKFVRDRPFVIALVDLYFNDSSSRIHRLLVTTAGLNPSHIVNMWRIFTHNVVKYRSDDNIITFLKSVSIDTDVYSQVAEYVIWKRPEITDKYHLRITRNMLDTPLWRYIPKLRKQIIKLWIEQDGGPYETMFEDLQYIPKQDLIKLIDKEPTVAASYLFDIIDLAYLDSHEAVREFIHPLQYIISIIPPAETRNTLATYNMNPTLAKYIPMQFAKDLHPICLWNLINPHLELTTQHRFCGGLTNLISEHIKEKNNNTADIINQIAEFIPSHTTTQCACRVPLPNTTDSIFSWKFGA